jgi:ligand-binding sensor domain-containing protein
MIRVIRGIVCAMALLTIIAFPVDAEEYSFYKLSLEDGLLSNSVYRIEQDYIGYMWFGTFSGLNRYDGTEIKTYKPEPGNKNSLNSPVIFELFEDSRMRLWIGTDGGGLNLYNRREDNFTVYRHDSENESSISSNNVYSLCEDAEKNLWIGTGGGGLNLFHEETGSFSTFKATASQDTLDSDVIRVVFCDSSGRLWIGTEGGGLSLFSSENDTFLNYRFNIENDSSISSDTVRSIFEDSLGHFWIGTEGGGLNLFDPSEGTFRIIENKELSDPVTYSVRSINEDTEGRIWIGTEGQGVFIIDSMGNILQRIRANEEDSRSLSEDKVRHIFIDGNGLMWIGTRDGGVNRFNPRTIGFRLESDKDIRDLFEDSHGNLWIGSDGEGLVQMDQQGHLLRSFTSDSDKNSLSSNQVYSLTEDHKGNMWIGTDGGGLNRYNPYTDNFTNYRYTPEDPLSINSNTVWSLLEDSKNRLWIGTEGGGLNLYDSEHDMFHYFLSIPEDTSTLNGNSIRTIFEDSYENLWIGTWDGGLNLYNEKDQTFERFSRDPEKIQSLSDSSVNTIFEDSSKRLWVGTAAGGLNLFDRTTKTFKHFGTEEGMSGDNIFGILEDDNQNLWISTNKGLTMFNPDKNEYLNFGVADGLRVNEFFINACLRSSDGEMLFGGPKGVNRFFPEKVTVNRKEPPVVITGIKVMNKPISFKQNDKSIITLTHKDSILSISFAVLDFAYPERNRYSVKLEGLQDQWTFLEGHHNIVYTSLPPGDYRFRVRGSDNNGIWNLSGSSVNIKVKSPWWNTDSFYLFISLLLLFLISAFIKMRLSRLEMKNKELRDYSIHIQDVREEERTAVARDVHDELGQTLTALKMELFRLNNKKDFNPHQIQESTGSCLL